MIAAVGAVATFMALLIGPGAAAVAAQDETIVAEDLDFVNYYVAPDAQQDISGFEALIDRANATGENWYFVSLGGEPDGGPAVFAARIAELLPDSGTVIVINEYLDGTETRFEAGIDSADYTDAQLNAGEDAAAAQLAGGSGSAIDVANALFAGLSEQTSESGGGASAAWLLVPVGGVGALYVGNRVLQKRKAEKRDVDDLATAKAEIKTQLDTVANYVISQADYVELSTNQEAKSYYAEATETFSEISDELDRTEDLLELAKLNDKVDLARWQMEAAEALIDGRDVPPKPTPDNPVACFFDPTHKPGTEVATIETKAGSKEVRVCAEDAAKLKRGERPEPRMIDVHGRRVPAAKAPRSHGGLGMGGIDIFDVVVGGIGRAARQSRRSAPRSSGGGFPWDWGNGRSSRSGSRSSGGVFGPDRIPRTRQGSGRSRTSTRSSGGSRPSRARTGRRSSTGRSRRRF